MLLVVADPAVEASYVPALEAAGYTLRIREPEWFEHRLLKGPDIDINLHVFSAGTSEVERMLRFRDWLRTNDTDRTTTREPSAAWLSMRGGMCSTMRRPKPRLSGRSWTERAQPSRIGVRHDFYNPVTQTRDLKYLLKRGYQVKEIQPVDMFTQTVHVETVVLITRVDK